MRISHRGAVALGLLIAVVSLVLRPPPSGDLRTASWEPTSRLGRQLYRGDTHLIAALARYPLPKPNDAMPIGEAAYRWQRPLPIWLVWLSTGGSPVGAPIALLVLMLVGLAWTVRELAEHVGGWAWLAAFLPPLFGSYGWLSPIALGCALFLYGARRRLAWPLLAAVLVREAFLPAVVVLALYRREPRLLMPLAFYTWWAVAVHARLGAWFWESPWDDRLSFALGATGSAEVLLFGATTAACMWAWARLRGFWRALLPTYIVGYLMMGSDVVTGWQNTSRALAPLYLTLFVAGARSWRPALICHRNDGAPASGAGATRG